MNFKTLGYRAKDFLNIHKSQGSNPQKDTSRGLDGQDTKNLAPPWQGWEPDSNFLHDLHKWNIAHKDDKLPAILANVNSVLESDPPEVALGFIPSSPFPAKPLVKTILSLIQLGIKIPQAKQDIHNFSNQIVVDITHLADVFGETGGSPMSQKAWEGLQETRDLVNKISKWAHDGLYQKLSNTSSAEQEKENIKKKLSDARRKFLQITIIRALGALEALDLDNDKIEDFRRHDEIIRRLQFINEALGDRVVPQAKYDSKEQKKRDYHDETCKVEEMINEIEQWARTPSDIKNKNCWWITCRPAVVGKPSIGAKVAKAFQKEKTLYAQYFVTRDVAATTDPDNILPTMAQQLAEKSPLAALVIQDKLETPLKEFSDGQARSLLLEPLLAIAQYAPKVVVVIHGVDELANAEPSIISKVISVLCGIMSDLPANVKILIFSQPKRWIGAKIPLHVRRVDFEIKGSQDKVERLVRAKLGEIAEFYEWKDWASEDQVTLLCRFAAGQLVVAKIALKWIANQLELEGSARRDEVIDELSRLGTVGIDDFFAFLLESILPSPQEPARRKHHVYMFQTVLGCLMVLQDRLEIGTISTLLSPDFDVLHFMRRISIFMYNGTELTERTVPWLDGLFTGYLLSGSSHYDVYIDCTDHHRSLATTCFKNIQKLTFNVGHITSSHQLYEKISISEGLTYACQWFGIHLENGGEQPTPVPDVEKFMKTDFLHWLEVLSLQGLVDSVAVSTLEILEKMIENSALTFFIGDAIKFIKKFKEPIASNAAQIYISALPLAFSYSLVSQHYLPRYPRTLSVKGGPQTWDELQEKLVSVTRACVSLDGTLIAAIFADKTLGIYDTTTGGPILPLFKVDENPRSVIFSQDGKLVVSGGQALRLWNVQTGEEIESFDIDVYSLAFSPDGTCIAAGCGGSLIEGDDRGYNNIRVINLEPAMTFYSHHVGSITRLKGELSTSPFKGHENQVNSVAYSPDGRQIASTSDDSTVRVWNVSTGSRRMFSANSSSIRCVAFSPDGTQIAVDKGLFNLSTGSFTPHAFGDEVNSIAFSADGRFLTLGSSGAAACQIWDTLTFQTILQLVGHTDDVRSLSFFPDGKNIMSASKDGTIRIWNVESLKERGEIIREMDGWRMERRDDGYWVLGSEKERLFWTPLPFRHTRNTLVIGKCLTIDTSNFVHGDEWVKCREPL